MAQIRVPKAANALLQYCSAHRQKFDDAFFPSYAHMMIFAASLGYQRDEFDIDVTFVQNDPYPIGMDIFKNQGLMDFIIILGLVKERKPEIVDNEDELAKIVEGYACSGFRHMLSRYDSCGGSNYLDDWVQMFCER